MSLRSLRQFFKISKKNEKSEYNEISVPIEGFEHSIQLLLAYAGQDISDFTFTESSKTDRSPETPSTFDIKTNLHGTAVLRYLGRCNNLAGADPFEDLEIDQIVDVFMDFVLKIQTLQKVEDSAEKTRQLQKFKESEALVCLIKLDAVIAANNGHLALNKLTWADFLVTGMWSCVADVLQINDDKKFPHIRAMVEHVKSIPQIKLALKRINKC